MRRSVQMVGTLVDQQKGQDARNRGRSSAHIHLYRLALAHSPLGWVGGGGEISNSMLMSRSKNHIMHYQGSRSFRKSTTNIEKLKATQVSKEDKHNLIPCDVYRPRMCWSHAYPVYPAFVQWKSLREDTSVKIVQYRLGRQR